MMRYDTKISVYDNLDSLADAARGMGIEVDSDFDANTIVEAKIVVSALDDDLKDIIEHLDEINEAHSDDQLTLKIMNEFFEDELPAILKDLNKLRERLY